MNKRWYGWAAAAVCALLVTAGVYRYVTAPLVTLPSLQALTVQAGEAHELAWPAYGQAAIATKDYGVLAAHGDTAPQPTASTAKLILAVAIMQKKPYDDGRGEMITFGRTDVDLYHAYLAGNGTVAAVTHGLTWTQHQALQAVMLASANNVSDTLAVWAFGSMETYRSYAQDMVRGLGMNDTTIGIDASGYSATTISTAHDLALLAAEALQYQPLREIVAMQSVTLPVAGTITNTNRLLGNGAIIGMKTGWTPEAGGVFVLVGKHASGEATQEIITVVMGAPGGASRVAQDAAYALYESAKQNFTYQQVVKEGQQVGSYQPAWSREMVPIVASRSLGMFVWRGARPDVTLRVDTVLPGRYGKVGTAHVSYGTWSVDMPLRIDKLITPPLVWWRIFHP